MYADGSVKGVGMDVLVMVVSMTHTPWLASAISVALYSSLLGVCLGNTTGPCRVQRGRYWTKR